MTRSSVVSNQFAEWHDMDRNRAEPAARDESPRLQDETVGSSLPAHRPSPLIRNLAAYDNSGFDPGRRFFVRTLWYFLSLVLFESGWFPASRPKSVILRLFGAKIGRGLVIRPNVRIKFPWKLSVGDHCWIGQEVWIDNLDHVLIGNNVCISQGVYLCTGSHAHRSPTFELRVKPIRVGDGVWLAAKSMILQGVTVGDGAVVGAGNIVSNELPTWTIVKVPRTTGHV